eukprot:11462943-Alexandrium_andersonii.AAC.1
MLTALTTTDTTESDFELLAAEVAGAVANYQRDADVAERVTATPKKGRAKAKAAPQLALTDETAEGQDAPTG